MSRCSFAGLREIAQDPIGTDHVEANGATRRFDGAIIRWQIRVWRGRSCDEGGQAVRCLP